MYVKRLKRKCNVRGCKNTDTYAISKTREMGNSIIACKSCLLEALKTIEEAEKPLAFDEAIPVATETPVEAITDEIKAEISPAEEKPVEAEKTPKKRKK